MSIDRFLAAAGWSGTERAPLAGDASARVYERLSRPGGTAVLMRAPPEDRHAFDAFLRIDDWLRGAGFSAPEILAADPGAGLMLLEDLGDGLLATLAATGAGTEARLYRAAGEVVVALGRTPPPPDLPVLDADGLAALVGLAFDEAPEAGALRADWDATAPGVFRAHLGSADTASLRDLHAGNLLWLPEREGIARIGILDFQDAVVAPAGYDLASLVDDPRRDVPAALRAELIAAHAAATGDDPGGLALRVDLLSLARNLRILGIFRRVARLRGRPSYLDFLPRTAALVARAAGRAEAAPLRPVVRGLLAAYGHVEAAT
ncbi:phosphotransferase [Rhodobacterales bacterium HKCCE2091]|nr:phosphotransferase [Rhodobacterales bacterium HKCCE2091]